MHYSFRRHIQLIGTFGTIRFFIRKHIRRDAELSLLMKGRPFPVYLRNYSTDLRVFGQIMINEEYKSGVGSLHPKVIIDCGANIGLASLYFAYQFPQATIYAFEPEESNYEMLVKNVSKFPNIKTFRTAVWSESTGLRLNKHNDHDSFSVGKTDEDVTDLTISAVSILDIMRENSLATIDLLKIDIEGAELELFKDNIDWLSETEVVIVEVHERINPGSSAFIDSVMAEQFEVSYTGEYTVYSKKIKG